MIAEPSKPLYNQIGVPSGSGATKCDVHIKYCVYKHHTSKPMAKTLNEHIEESYHDLHIAIQTLSNPTRLRIRNYIIRTT